MDRTVLHFQLLVECHKALINHISATLVSNVKLFADDLKLYLLIKSQNLSTVLKGISTIQRDTDSLIEVAESWDLKINADKTKLVSFGANLRQSYDLGPYSFFTVKGNPLRLSSSAVDLGITVDPSLIKIPSPYSIPSVKGCWSVSFLYKVNLVSLAFFHG